MAYLSLEDVTMAVIEEYEKLIVDTKQEFPGFEIIEKKDSTLMKVIDACLKIITFGQMKLFMTGFVTTLGQKVYVPDVWKDYLLASKVEVLRHEIVHMRQAKKYGRVLFSILYLLVPFPTGVAYFRKKFEQEAYEESLRAMYVWRGAKVLDSKDVRERILSNFTSASYFWMWPFRKDLDAWYDSIVEKIKKENA